jgi:hypothetical protein
MNNQIRTERSAKGAIGAILGMATLGLVVAAALAKQRSRKGQVTRGYGKEGSLDGAVQPQVEMSDFKMPEDMRAVIPEPPSYAPA